MPSLLEDTGNPQTDSSLLNVGGDGWGDALGHLYSTVKRYMAPETPLWDPLTSPVGTSRVGGDTSVGMPDPNVSLALDTSWGGSRPPLASEWKAMERGTQIPFQTMAAGEFGDMGPGPRGPVTLASRRVRAPGAGPRPPEPSAQVTPDAGLLGIRAFHGSPADFNAFSDQYIGTGEGAQAFGRGHYAAESEGVARSYRDKLAASDRTASALSPDGLAEYHSRLDDAYHDLAAERGISVEEARASDAAGAVSGHVLQGLPDQHFRDVPQGKMYELAISADPEHMLDWDKPLSEQSQHVRDALAKTGVRIEGKDPTGSQMWLDVVSHHGLLREGAAAPASTTLKDAGIPGIKYLDQGSRAKGEGTSNYVVFDPATIEILRKYGIAGLIAGGGAAAVGTQRQDQ